MKTDNGYRSMVLNAYHEKVHAREFPTYMANPTPAKLKRLCIEFCQLNYNKKDEKIFSDFFGQCRNREDCIQAVEQCDPDKFRPLESFIKGKTSDPDISVLELLAWLSDFQYRPYNPSIDYTNSSKFNTVNEQEQKVNEANLIENNNESEDPPHELAKKTINSVDTNKPEKSSKKRRILILTSAGLLILAIIGFQLFYKGKKAGQIAVSGDCMYWNGVKYSRTHCGPHGRDTTVVPIPKTGIPNLEKVTRPDTITHYSVGKLYCIRVGKDYEFYTSGGVYPMDTTKDLKRLSAYIVNNYLFKNQTDSANLLGLKSHQ